MSLHAARLIAEKRISHPPAAVLFSGASKGIDMTKEYEFIVGDCGSVRTNADGFIDMEFLPVDVCIDGELLFEMKSPIKDAEIVGVHNISPEQAYLLGRALLMAAKFQGISE